MNIDYTDIYSNEFDVKERKKSTANILRFLRELYGLQMKEIARFIGINNQTYRTYEIGRNETPQEIIVRLSFLYEVPTDYLLQKIVIDNKSRHFAGEYNAYMLLKLSKRQLESLKVSKSNVTYKLICKALDDIKASDEEYNKTFHSNIYDE